MWRYTVRPPSADSPADTVSVRRYDMSNRNNNGRRGGSYLEILNVPLTFKRQPVFFPSGRSSVMECAVIPPLTAGNFPGKDDAEREERCAKWGKKFTGRIVLPVTRCWDVKSRPVFNSAVRLYLRRDGGLAFFAKADVMNRERRTYSEHEYAVGQRRASCLVSEMSFAPEKDSRGRTALIGYDDNFFGQEVMLRLEEGQSVEPGKRVKVLLVEREFRSIALLIENIDEVHRVVKASEATGIVLGGDEQEEAEALLKTPTPVITVARGHKGAVTERSHLAIGFNPDALTATTLGLAVEEWTPKAINAAFRKKAINVSVDRVQEMFKNNLHARTVFEEQQKALVNAAYRAKEYLKRLEEAEEAERAMEAEAEREKAERAAGTYEGKERGIANISMNDLANALLEATADVRPVMPREELVAEDEALEAEAAALMGKTVDDFRKESRKIRRSWCTKAKKARAASKEEQNATQA